MSFVNQLELIERVFAMHKDERSTAQTLTSSRHLHANSGGTRAPGAQSMSSPISSKGGAADHLPQDRALLTVKGFDAISATSYSLNPAVISPQGRALLTAEGIDAISANNAVSPFLSLTQELKDRVYELACGEHLIHIKYSTDDELSHHICQAVVTENDAQNILDKIQYPWFTSNVAKRHELCYNQGMREPLSQNAHRGLFRCEPSPKHPYNLDLRFLRTCKQIHWEAKSIPFTSNTFSFTRPHILYAFLARNPNGTHVNNAALIRKVHLEMTIYHAFGEQPWFDVLTTITSRLNSLQRLYVEIDFRPYATFSLQRGFDPVQKQFLKDLLQLRLPQLRTVTLILSDYSMGKARPMIDEKHEWSEYIKGVLRPKLREGDGFDGHLAI